MAIDRKYIFNKVNFFLRQENKFFTSGELHVTIGVDAFRRIAEEIDYPKSNYSTFVASGVWTVSMSSNFLKVDQSKDMIFKDSSDIYRLKPKSQTNIGRHIILDAATAVPESYFMENENTIGIYPPSTSGLVVIPFVKVPTALSSDTDTNELTENCYMAATYWTVAECFDKDNDPRADKFTMKYQAEILRLKKRFGEMYEEPKDLMPDENYL